MLHTCTERGRRATSAAQRAAPLNPMEIDCFAPSHGFERRRPQRPSIPVTAVLIGGPLMMLVLVMIGIAAGTMLSALF